jgi:hypothetical protein
MLLKRRQLRVGIGGSAAILVAAAIGLVSAVPASAAECIPRPDGTPYCVEPGTALAGLLDGAEEPAASIGDIPDHEVPDPETCWEALSDPAYYAMDGTIHTLSITDVGGGCGHPGGGGTTVYYNRNPMHDGYDHPSNFNHKLSNWFRMWSARGCNSSDCEFRVFSTNSRNNVVSGLTVTGYGSFVGLDFNRRAVRDLCGWINTGYFNVAPPKPVVSCYYQYG